MKRCPEIIRGLREDKDLKQSDIAQVIGTTQQQYSKYETGESELSVHALMELANYYGTSTDYLLGRTRRKEGVVSSGEMMTDEYSASDVVSEMSLLTPAKRASAIDYILFLRERESAVAQRNKQNLR